MSKNEITKKLLCNFLLFFAQGERTGRFTEDGENTHYIEKCDHIS
jgi:hypothetical protein